LTGLSGSGKTTIATSLYQALTNLGIEAHILDGDQLRVSISKDLGFLEKDRKENIMRAALLAKEVMSQGKIAIVALISPYEEARLKAKNHFSKEQFVEVYVDTPLDTCIHRDPKGLYAKAIRGEIKNFTGIDAPYEPPQKPDLILKTEDNSPSDLVEILLKHMGLKR